MGEFSEKMGDFFSSVGYDINENTVILSIILWMNIAVQSFLGVCIE